MGTCFSPDEVHAGEADPLADLIAAAPQRLRATLRAMLHAVQHYTNPNDADVARDLNVSVRTVRRHRRRLRAALKLPVPPLRPSGVRGPAAPEPDSQPT